MASPHHPQYGLIVWGLSSAVMFISIAELIYKGMIKEKLSVLQCLKSLLPFSSSGGKKPYSFVDGLILLGAKVQMVLASIAYAYLRQGKENPIKISLVSLVFMVCYAFSKLHKDGNEANLLPVRQEN
ncbi:hypothetical protein P3X46_011347 [Hevea brasiliensis]|uniref:Uncharacterized protein n=1 Tax=Hevea brasiliensis TaxID=3981 RepID=A0ABQ9ML66_HEVBR|nr:hypothetical protein P3X46_011347 [Hevea brasiliensis]